LNAFHCATHKEHEQLGSLRLSPDPESAREGQSLRGASLLLRQPTSSRQTYSIFPNIFHKSASYTGAYKTNCNNSHN